MAISEPYQDERRHRDLWHCLKRDHEWVYRSLDERMHDEEWADQDAQDCGDHKSDQHHVERLEQLPGPKLRISQIMPNCLCGRRWCRNDVAGSRPKVMMICQTATSTTK